MYTHLNYRRCSCTLLKIFRSKTPKVVVHSCIHFGDSVLHQFKVEVTNSNSNLQFGDSILHQFKVEVTNSNSNLHFGVSNHYPNQTTKFGCSWCTTTYGVSKNHTQSFKKPLLDKQNP